jgi:hypothetical protein
LKKSLRLGILSGVWDGPERRSRASGQARALVAMKQAAAAAEERLERLPGWRRKARAELREIRDDLRAQERQLLEALGARP